LVEIIGFLFYNESMSLPAAFIVPILALSKAPERDYASLRKTLGTP
jgi:hypothetical protein